MKLYWMKKVANVFLIMLLMPSIVFAHSGGTDASGGHNSPTGYHYHHGYSAHQHTDGICPYEFNDATEHQYGSSYSSASKNSFSSYFEGYDKGKVAGFENAKDEYIPYIVGAAAVPSVIGIGIISKMKRMAYKRKESISQLISQEAECQNRIKKLTSEAKMLERANSERYQALIHKIQEAPLKKYGRTIDGDTTFDYLIPEGVVINKMGLPEEEYADKVQGDKYYVFASFSSNICHRKTCYHAKSGYRTHVLIAKDKYRACTICKPTLPDLNWYYEYLSLHQSRQNYEEEQMIERNSIE